MNVSSFSENYSNVKPFRQNSYISNSPNIKHNNSNISENIITSSKSDLYIEENDLYSSNWNLQFQLINNLSDENEKISRIATITKNFQFHAKKYGEIIISEKLLPVEKKIIKPISLGGIAGGDKFVVHGMLFKFAQDVEVGKGVYLYGYKEKNDYLAQKSVGHELKNISALFDVINKNSKCSDFKISLSCRVDFMGFRLFVQSLLPIDKESLVYGSKDGGKTIHSDNEKVTGIMEEIGKTLFLKKHICLDKKKFRT
eukprot:TRINITY_DN4343_c0_g1_i3.p1 TRINITY_DN4343_c0_g1~~TRINITY_DN4343_c0_g1_i3.p1  ORF type:complete len:256 (-),score=68.36 TRINITY_DN4343_c0_g1_i3:637-1404(-)